MSSNPTLITFGKLKLPPSFPNIFFLIEDPEPSISYIHIPFILNTKNGYPEDMLTMGHLKTELIYIRILPR